MEKKSSIPSPGYWRRDFNPLQHRMPGVDEPEPAHGTESRAGAIPDRSAIPGLEKLLLAPTVFSAFGAYRDGSIKDSVGAPLMAALPSPNDATRR